MRALILLSSLVAGAVLAAPAPWPLWDVSDETSSAAIDHAPWQALLDKYLDAQHPSGIARFDYAAARAGAAELQAYLGALQALDPRDYRRDEQRAYWINLYNAATVALVIEHYPVASIREIHGGLLRRGPWREPLLTVAGETLTLDDIEHRILRPLWRDPRLHYAVNCASLGCPNLAAQAYTARNTEALLEAGARAYVNHARGAAFVDGTLRVSSLYDWYQEDFGGSEAGVRAHLARYAGAGLAARLAGYSGPLRYGYDWALNAP